jgi:sugar/nucleoside kinase (ribokinase family)
MRQPAFDVAGIGNALVDVLAEVDDGFLARHGLRKGSMTLVDAARADALEAALGARRECAGGSAANTMVGVASLGGSAAYVGKVRDDRLGRAFRDNIHAAGVAFDTAPAHEGPPTGRSVVLVTPDAQRTMQTLLGASATLAPEDVDPGTIAAARITLLEGYLFDPPPAKRAFLRAAELAHAAGRRIALSLSDRFCVERHRAEFRSLVAGHVDVLLANEDEAVALYEVTDLDEAVERAGADCAVAAITRGAAGSIVVGDGLAREVEAAPVARVVDTTGAGDLYAAGFLFGLCRGEDLAECGRLGAIAAAEVIGHVGARPERSLAELAGRRGAAR